MSAKEEAALEPQPLIDWLQMWGFVRAGPTSAPPLWGFIEIRRPRDFKSSTSHHPSALAMDRHAGGSTREGGDDAQVFRYKY